jgi:hypothetical protein
VLFNTLSKYVDRPDSGILYASIIFLVDFVVSFVGSMALGLFCGLGSAQLLKAVLNAIMIFSTLQHVGYGDERLLKRLVPLLSRFKKAISSCGAS